MFPSNRHSPETLNEVASRLQLYNLLRLQGFRSLINPSPHIVPWKGISVLSLDDDI